MWADKGFKIETGGWFQPRLVQDWTGMKLGITIPEGGSIVLEQSGSFRFWMECKGGWVYDKGIIVSRGCEPPDERTGRDTLGYRYLNVSGDEGCDEQAGRVLMIVRLPHFFPTADCRPTKVEWVRGDYYEAD